MSKLPPLRLIPPPQWQIDRLSAWIEEWNIDQHLRQITDFPEADEEKTEGQPFSVVGSSKEIAVRLVRPFDSDIAIGEIRLFSSQMLPAADYPVYFVVLSEEENDRLRIVPFSRFANPATPGEWLTGRNENALRVLSVWNFKIVHRQSIGKSWIVDELSAEELQTVWAVFKHVTTREPLPAGIVKQVGPPLNHLRDPRLRYQDEEALLLSSLDFKFGEDAGDHANPEGDERLVSLAPFLAELEELEQRQSSLLAAATLQDQLPGIVFYSPNYQVYLSLDPAGDSIGFTVLDHEGELSSTLDGALVFGSEGVPVATLRNSQVLVPRATLTHGFRIAFANKKPIRLVLDSTNDDANQNW